MENIQPLIDVVIPAFNAEKFLERAVNSVLKQTLLPQKLIIVNDGSKDQTQKIIEKLISENTSSVKIISHTQSNSGPSAARNKGIELSTSPFIALLDSDDEWLPHKLEKQMQIFQRSDSSKLGLIYCRYDVIDENSKIISGAEIIQPGKDLRGDVFRKFTHGNLISGSDSGVLLKRECFEKAGVFDTTLHAYEDWDMWLRIALHYEFDYADEILAHIRSHSGNMQKDFSHMNKNSILFYKKWLPMVDDKEVLRKWAFQVAKPAYASGFDKDYLAWVRKTFSPEDLRKLFNRTFGSLSIYLFLKRLTTKAKVKQ